MASTTLTGTTPLARAARQLHTAARAARAIAAQREQHPMRANPRPPVPGDAVSYADLDALPNAPYWARRLTKTALQAWRLWPETIQTAEVLVSELVTNAVKATSVGTEQVTYAALADVPHISLTLRRLPGRVIAEVFDTDQRPPLLAAASTDDEGGRGLMLVQALSKEWGYCFPPTGGKVVYCVLSG
jgi:anti-sigma regulatory factor (Ser/Thr protein kinase)